MGYFFVYTQWYSGLMSGVSQYLALYCQILNLGWLSARPEPPCHALGLIFHIQCLIPRESGRKSSQAFTQESSGSWTPQLWAHSGWRIRVSQKGCRRHGCPGLQTRCDSHQPRACSEIHPIREPATGREENLSSQGGTGLGSPTPWVFLGFLEMGWDGGLRQ